MSRSLIKTAAVAAAAFLSFSSIGFAQGTFQPDQPIKFIVPSPAGTTLDLLPRIIAEKLTNRWKQPIIVLNRAGAANTLGAEAVYKAEPDGLTLLVTPPGTLVLSYLLDGKTSYDPEAFVPVTIMVGVTQILIVNPNVPVKNFSEWVAYAKANPGKMAYGSPGATSAANFAQEELFRALDVKLVHVPYQGMLPAVTDMIGNNIQTMFVAAGTGLPAIKDGKIRAVAITGGERLPQLPDVAVIKETYPSFDHTEWFAIVAPPKTPAYIVEELSKGIAAAMAEPDVQERIKNLALTPIANSPTEAAKFIASERIRWKAIVDARRARGDQLKP